MKPFVPDADVVRFRAALATRLGLAFDDGKLPFLGALLVKRLRTERREADDLLRRLEEGDIETIRAIAADVTVAETYFFRNPDQFRALAEVVLPEIMAARARIRRVSFLSAGCASGEEPYSIAMLAKQYVPNDWEVVLRAADVSPAALQRARRARYSPWSLRETPPEVVERWFRYSGSELVLDARIRESVRFEEVNLLEGESDLWARESYDVVFCRNVLMYFTPDAMRQLVGAISASLAPGGYLFLGHAETLRALSDDFHLCHTHNTFYYRKRAPQAAAHPHDGPKVARVAAAHAGTGTQDGPDWFVEVERATARIHALARAHERASERKAESASRGKDVSELIRAERFHDALEALREIRAGDAETPEILLLEAALLTQKGQLDAAEEACRRLLRMDELSASAHYLLALCREGAGDREAAAEHDRIALHLDPTFSMARLHLGLMARRSGEVDGARRELEDALVLIEREDPSRLLLFGGGFTRDTLVALCRAELSSLRSAR